MPLPLGLSEITMSHPCQNCGHKLERRGSWFLSQRQFTCRSCLKLVTITYDEKIRLFDSYARKRLGPIP
jgi:hypothetical protein